MNARPAWVGRNSIAWGEPDEAGILTMHTEDGPWFAVDVATGKDVPLERDLEPEPTGIDWVARMHEMADEVVTVSRCYFIGADEGPVKIGHSINVEDRLKQFQAGCPVTLHILATVVGGVDREVAYHAQFAAHRLHGEWFARHPDILAEIERLSV